MGRFSKFIKLSTIILISFSFLSIASAKLKSRWLKKRTPASSIHLKKGWAPENWGKVDSMTAIEFNKKYDRQARGTIARIVRELNGKETVANLLNSGSRKNKMKRRKYFNQMRKRKIPKFIVGTYGIAFADNKGVSHSFNIYPGKNGLVRVFDGVDISPREKERYSQWIKRFRKITKQKGVSLFDFLIPKAYAEDAGLRPLTFANLLTFLSNDDWEIFDFNNALNDKVASFPAFWARDLDAKIDYYAKEPFNLSCGGDGSASFSFDMGNGPRNFRVPKRSRPDDRNFQIVMSDKNKSLGRFDISLEGNSGTFTNSSGNKYENESFLPAVSRAAYDGVNPDRLPLTSPQQWENPVHPNDLVGAHEALVACKALKQAGVTKCDEFIGNPIQFHTCAMVDIMKAGLPGGVRMLNYSPLHHMTEKDALLLKLRLQAAYNGFPYEFNTGVDFPAMDALRDRPSPNWQGPNALGEELFIEGLSVNIDRTGDFGQSVLQCVRSIRSSRSSSSCSSEIRSALRADNNYAMTKLENLAGYGASRGNTVNYLGMMVEDDLEGAGDCAAFMTEEKRQALNDYRELEAFNGGNGGRVMAARVSQVVTVADGARAICGNQGLRQRLNDARGSGSSE